ncbi:MAG: RNA-binding S4 domain-containing protein [Clostridiales bacterium]|nr:RNA-binding S4 domain-containing protein [Clostridiales bacterium]
MRVDKFLKVSRLIKRRTIAKEACDRERITINGRTAKAGSEVKVGDLVEIHFGNSTISAKVLKLSESCRKEDAETMYEIVDGG